jgi:hypothetical protein
MKSVFHPVVAELIAIQLVRQLFNLTRCLICGNLCNLWTAIFSEFNPLDSRLRLNNGMLAN